MRRAVSTDESIVIEALQPSDWPAVASIYAEGIASGDATFEAAAPEWPEWDRTHLSEHRLVARRDGEVLGWIAASPVSSRCVYRGVVEESVYVAGPARGQGVGLRLLSRFIASTELTGIWTIETCVFPENAASLALHDSCGFRRVGLRERIGAQRGRWRDVVLLERRSRSP